MFYNKEEDRFFCLLDAPNKEAIEKHHARFGLKCEWITESTQASLILFILIPVHYLIPPQYFSFRFTKDK